MQQNGKRETNTDKVQREKSNNSSQPAKYLQYKNINPYYEKNDAAAEVAAT